MMSVAAQVREAVARDPDLHRMLAAGVVNLNAMARYLRSEGLFSSVSQAAVVSALRRLRHTPGVRAEASQVLDRATIETASGLASITLHDTFNGQAGRAIDPGLIDALAPRWEVRSPKGIRLVVPDENINGMEDRLLAIAETQIRRGLTELAVILGHRARRVPGVLAIACRRLADAGINIVETVDGFSQHTFLVTSQDALRAKDALRAHPLGTKAESTSRVHVEAHATNA